MGNIDKVKTKKPFYKSLCMLALAAIVVGSLTGCSSDESATGSAESTESVKEYAIGEEVKVDKLIYKVNGVEEKTSVKSGWNSTKEGTFIVVDVVVKNGDKEARSIDEDLFKIITPEGVEYSSDYTLNHYANEDVDFFFEDINPNLSLAGKVIFEVSSDISEYDLQVSSGLGWSGGEYETIKLK